MATFTTNFADSAAFFAVVDSNGVDFGDFEGVGQMLDDFQHSTRSIGESGDETANHRTGLFTVAGDTVFGFTGGDFHAVGNLPSASTGSWTINGLIVNLNDGGTNFGEIVFQSTAGITVNPALTDTQAGGTVNSIMLHAFDAPSTYDFELDFLGAVTIDGTTLNAKQIHIRDAEDLDTTPVINEGTVNGTFSINMDTGAVTGTINSIAMDINGMFLEASGFSVSADTLFNHTGTAPEMETLFSLILAGNDVISGGEGTTNQTLRGYVGNDSIAGGGANDSLVGDAGNDTLVSGGNDTTLVGGTGNDLFDIGSWTGQSISEDTAVGGGVDTVRTTNTSYTLGGGFENLIYVGESGTNLQGNELNNKITGGTGNNGLYGMAGNDTLIGGNSGNWLEGGTGNDSALGGTGDDWYLVESTGDKVGAEAVNGGHDLVYAGVSQTLGANYEDLKLWWFNNDNINGTGNALANLIEGNAGNNSLAGMAGDDSITGGGGNDKIAGGDGNDTISGVGTSMDSIDGGTGNDSLVGGDFNDTVVGGAGDDTIAASGGIDVLDGGMGNDQVTGGASGNTLIGGAGADTLAGGIANDKIDGGDGNDVITDAGGGTNTLLGGGDNDTINSVNLADSVDGGAGIDTLMMASSGGTMTLGGGVENLVLNGSEGIDATGNALANIITSGATSDTLRGAGGNDTYNISAGDSVVETDSSAGGGIDLVVFGDAAPNTYTLTSNVENLTLFGNSMTGVGNELANVLRNGGESASQIFDGKGGNDTYHVFQSDTVGEDSSGGGTDVVFAHLFNGQTYALAGGSNIENLTLIDDDVSTTVNGAGNELNNVITGATKAGANNNLGGGLGNDTLLGSAGNDTLAGDAGTDSLSGGAGDDMYVFDFGGTGAITSIPDAIADSGGNDTVAVIGLGEGASVTFALPTPIENFDGSSATGIAYSITGNASNNRLVGGNVVDSLNGGAGNDTLDGGAGNDQLVGGAGNDYYVFDGADGTAATGYGETSTGGTLDILQLASSGNFNIGANAANNNGIVDLTNFEGLVLFNNEGAAINGTAGANFLGSLGPNSASLTGFAGNDTYSVMVHGVGGADTVIEDTSAGGGIDTVIANLTDLQQWTLGAGLENLTLIDAGGANAISGVGNTLANKITGAAGASVSNNLQGGDGNDTITGGAGSDWLQGDAGTDSLAGGLGNDSYWVNLKALAAGALEDAIADTGGVDRIWAQGNNTVTGFTFTLPTAIEQFVLENAHFNSTLTGGAADNYIYGGFNNDKIDGAAGNDMLDGGEGGDDTLLGGLGNDELWGSGATGGTGGNNSLNGGAGDDSYHGGSGNDIFVMAQAGDQVQSDNDGIDTMLVSVTPDQFADNHTGFHVFEPNPAGGMIYIGEEVNNFIENVTYTGAGAINIYGNDLDNVLTGHDGNDVLDGAEGGDDTLIGGLGNDMLYGGYDFNTGYGGSNDSLSGGAGNDTLDGGEGADVLSGDAGNDSLYGGMANSFVDDDFGDTITGGAGNDTLDGGEGGSDSLAGGDGNDSLYGGQDSGDGADDTLTGDAGNDTLDGGWSGVDSLSGGAGNDSIYAGNGGLGDNLSGDAGNDTLRGHLGNDTLSGGDGSDRLDGAEGGDSMTGGAGDDTYFVDDGGDRIVELAGGGTDTANVSGFFDAFNFGANVEKFVLGDFGVALLANAQANSITGGDGSDTIAGGGGNDTVTGGDGADTFVLGWGDATVTANHVMLIKDFDQSEGDLIGLSGTPFAAILGPMNADDITNGATANAVHEQLVYKFSTGELFYDADGTGAGVQVLVAKFDAATKPLELHSDDFTQFNGII